MIAQEVVALIQKGIFDDDSELDKIAAAVKARRKVISSRKFYEVSLGDHGTLQNLSPKYLIGVGVTVVDRKTTRLVVKVDEKDRLRARRYGFGSITITPNMIKVDENG